MPFTHGHVREIDAPATVVWQVLTDFDAYGEWNPFAVSARCDLRPGGLITMDVALFPGRPMKQTERVVSVDEGRGFAYSMKPVPGGMLRSIREQVVEDLGDGRSKYSSHFRIDGHLSSVVALTLGRLLRRGFDRNVDALVERARSLAA